MTEVQALCTVLPQRGLPTLRAVGGCNTYRRVEKEARNGDVVLACGHVIPARQVQIRRVTRPDGGGGE